MPESLRPALHASPLKDGGERELARTPLSPRGRLRRRRDELLAVLGDRRWSRALPVRRRGQRAADQPGGDRCVLLARVSADRRSLAPLRLPAPPALVAEALPAVQHGHA